MGDGSSRRTRARRQRLADSAFEYAGADGMRVELGPERHVGAIGEDRRVLDARADRLQVDRVRILDADRALRVADLDVLEGEAVDAAFAVWRSLRIVLALQLRAAHVDLARRRPGDRRADLPRERLDGERVRVGPAAAAQVHDRLAGAVAGQLRLAAVGVEDAQPGDVSGLIGGPEQQHAVTARTEVRIAQLLDLAGGQLGALEDEVVVAEGLPLLEAQALDHAVDGVRDVLRAPVRG